MFFKVKKIRKDGTLVLDNGKKFFTSRLSDQEIQRRKEEEEKAAPPADTVSPEKTDK